MNVTTHSLHNIFYDRPVFIMKSNQISIYVNSGNTACYDRAFLSVQNLILDYSAFTVFRKIASFAVTCRSLYGKKMNSSTEKVELFDMDDDSLIYFTILVHQRLIWQ